MHLPKYSGIQAQTPHLKSPPCCLNATPSLSPKSLTQKTEISKQWEHSGSPPFKTFFFLNIQQWQWITVSGGVRPSPRYAQSQRTNVIR